MNRRKITIIISVLLHGGLIWWFTMIVIYQPVRQPGIIKTSLTKLKPFKPQDVSNLFKKPPESKEVPKVEIPDVSLSIPKEREIEEIPKVIKEIIEEEETSIETIEKSVLKIGQAQGLVPGFSREIIVGGKGFFHKEGITRREISEIKEKTILRALEWLKSQQNPDGSWGRDYPVSTTGLALLTFISHQETQFTECYGLAVDRAIRYLGRIAESNEYGFMGLDIRSEYQHGIGTYALLEAYAASGSYRLLNPLRKAVNTIVETQGPKGGWIDYYDTPTPDKLGNTAISGWQIMALKAAIKTEGIESQELKEALKKSTEDLFRVYGQPGFGLYKPGQRLDLNGIGAFSLQLCGQPQSNQVSQTLSSLKDTELNWQTLKEDDVLECYFITQAMHYAGLLYWNDWNKKITQLLLDNQNKDGRWSLFEKSNEGQYNDTDIYITTLCALMLEVEYQSLVISSR